MALSRPLQVREIDFRRPSKFAREYVRRLWRAQDAFARGASSRLSAELRSEVQIAVMSSDQLPLGTVMGEEIPAEAMVASLEIEGLGSSIGLILELDFVLTLVDRLLGGDGSPREHHDGTLTDLEAALARRALGALVDPLSQTWTDLVDRRLTVTALDPAAVATPLAPPAEPTLLFNFQLRLDDNDTLMSLCLPYRSVAPLLDVLAASTDDDGGPEPSTESVRDAMGAVDIVLRAEVGGVDVPLADVSRLAPGDVIGLRRPAGEGVVLMVGDVPAYVAQPGRNAGVRAVQVTERC